MTEPPHAQKFFLFGDDAAEMADLELHDLKEPLRMNIKTDVTIFLTLTATFFSFNLGFRGSTKPLSLSFEDSL